MTREQIAKICHENNRQYCEALGDMSQPAWEDAPDWQRSSALNGVKLHIENPDLGDSHSHDAWMAEKLEDGWKYGAVKDPGKKEHPCMVAFDELPKDQQIKDALFRSTVRILSALTRLGRGELICLGCRSVERATYSDL